MSFYIKERIFSLNNQLCGRVNVGVLESAWKLFPNWTKSIAFLLQQKSNCLTGANKN